MKHRSYPVREGGGFVWVWMGPPEEMREFEPPAWAPHPNCRTRSSRCTPRATGRRCSRARSTRRTARACTRPTCRRPRSQGATATDSAWLRPSSDKAPKLQFEPTPYGFRYAAIRKPIRDPETHQYVRTTLFIAPFTVLIPPNDQYQLAQMLVPIDDVNTMFYWVAWHPDPEQGHRTGRSGAASARRRWASTWTPITARSAISPTDYLQDRAAMKRGDWTGIKGIPAQDMAMWESMGPIADRSKDKPGQSDVAVVQFRRMMVAAAKNFQDGGPAIGTAEPRIPHVTLASFEGVVPKSVDWRTLGPREATAEQAA